jgi:disulfide bond formation protein DsbB
MTQFIQNNINAVIGIGTLISHIVFVAVLVFLVAHPKFRTTLYRFIHRHVLTILFIEAMAALLGSLAYSSIVGFAPCELCWVQRIFIYPQALIAFVAMLKKDKSVVDYLFPMSIIGALVALYQSFIQWGFALSSVAKCVSVGGECARVYVNLYGYITIPFMSFTIFAYSLGVMLIYYQARKVHGA